MVHTDPPTEETFMEQKEPAPQPTAPAAEAKPETNPDAKEAAKEFLELLKGKDKPAPGFFEKYKVLIIVLAMAAVAFFFWKFKIVSKTAQAITQTV